jgi:hypothetical protein
MFLGIVINNSCVIVNNKSYKTCSEMHTIKVIRR